MRFNVRNEGDVVVFDLKGGLEGGPDTYKIKDRVGELLEQGRKKILLNMDDVGYVNSTGIGIVVAVYTSISSAGGQMKLCNANEKVSRVMMVTKLMEVFDTHAREEEALAAFQAA